MSAWDFVRNPIGFIEEKVGEAQAALEAALSDLEGTALAVIQEELRWDLLTTDPARWVGTVGCGLLIDMFTGSFQTRILAWVDDIVPGRNRNNNDNTDPDNTDPDGTDNNDDGSDDDETNNNDDGTDNDGDPDDPDDPENGTEDGDPEPAELCNSPPAGSCTAHVDADGNVTIIQDDGTVDFIDKDGNEYTDVATGRDGLPLIDSEGQPLPQATGILNAEWGVDEAWLDANGNPRYPDNNGRVPGTEIFGELDQSVTFDRYGETGSQYGAFLGEEGASLGDRALPPDRPNGYELFRYEPNPDRPPLPIIDSEVQPWFGQDGGGRQIEIDVQRIRETYGPTGTTPHPDFAEMLNGNRPNLDYWFTITSQG